MARVLSFLTVIGVCSLHSARAQETAKTIMIPLGGCLVMAAIVIIALILAVIAMGNKYRRAKKRIKEREANWAWAAEVLHASTDDKITSATAPAIILDAYSNLAATQGNSYTIRSSGGSPRNDVPRSVDTTFPGTIRADITSLHTSLPLPPAMDSDEEMYALTTERFMVKPNKTPKLEYSYVRVSG